MYILFAMIALGLIIFIHELGHYWMARRVGMKVEAFGIGFGKPIFSWERKGVKWNLCWIPFGGYVKIAGMEADDKVDPYTIPNGFFSKKPIDRIKVAVMGPVFNLVLALFVFFILWLSGGRSKNFSEFTPVIGWVDPQSQLYAEGVRPGDEVLYYGTHSFESTKDHLYAPMTASETILVKGNKVNYQTKEKTPFEYLVKVYPNPEALDPSIVTTGILGSANYMIYNHLPNGAENPLPEGSPLEGSGIEYGDRILWVDGELIFSDKQLSHLMNDNRSLLTIERKGQRMFVRVPRIAMDELKLDSLVRGEIADWQHEAGLSTVKFGGLYMIPYNVTPDAVVEEELKFIDKQVQEEAFPSIAASPLNAPLLPGDKILAVDGTAIKRAYQLLIQLQKRQLNIIVERDPSLFAKVSVEDVKNTFNDEVKGEDVNKLAAGILSQTPIKRLNNLKLLNPVTPKSRSELAVTAEKRAQLANELLEKERIIEGIEDPQKKAYAKQMLDANEKKLILGLPAYQDRRVRYNPDPLTLFGTVSDEIWRTLSALVTGSLSPKWLGGPVAMVQIVHDSWMISMKDGLFWIGAISLNLGLLNLLPIPVLDGGHICMAFFEMITGKKMKPKTMERLIIPFAVLVFGFIIFLTYNDLSRLLSSFF